MDSLAVDARIGKALNCPFVFVCGSHGPWSRAGDELLSISFSAKTGRLEEEASVQSEE